MWVLFRRCIAVGSLGLRKTELLGRTGLARSSQRAGPCLWLGGVLRSGPWSAWCAGDVYMSEQPVYEHRKFKV